MCLYLGLGVCKTGGCSEWGRHHLPRRNEENGAEARWDAARSLPRQRPTPTTVYNEDDEGCLFLRQRLKCANLRYPRRPATIPVFGRVPRPTIPSRKLSEGRSKGRQTKAHHSKLQCIFFQ